MLQFGIMHKPRISKPSRIRKFVAHTWMHTYIDICVYTYICKNNIHINYMTWVQSRIYTDVRRHFLSLFLSPPPTYFYGKQWQLRKCTANKENTLLKLKMLINQVFIRNNFPYRHFQFCISRPFMSNIEEECKRTQLPLFHSNENLCTRFECRQLYICKQGLRNT